jgi:hypothetical protein
MKSPSPSVGTHPIGDGLSGFEIQPPALDRIIVLSFYRIDDFCNGYKLVFSESPISMIPFLLYCSRLRPAGGKHLFAIQAHFLR